MTFLDVLGISFIIFCFYAAGSGGGSGQRSKSSHRHGDLEYRGVPLKEQNAQKTCSICLNGICQSQQVMYYTNGK